MKLLAGGLLILMSFAHFIYGENQQIKELLKLEVNQFLIGSFRVMSLQGSLLLFAVGCLELAEFFGWIHLNGFSKVIPLGFVCLNLVSCLIVAVVKHRELFKKTVPQFIIFLLIVLFQVLSLNWD